METISLGRTGLTISPMGLGAWQWGDRMMWGYGRGYASADVRAAFDEMMSAGVNWVDTAEVYGMGLSESLLGQFLRQRPDVFVATKFFPYPWRLSGGAVLKALRGSLRRLGLERVDLYQIHWPFPLALIESRMDAMAEAVKSGLARSVGVSNFNAEQTRRAHERLARHGTPLASNQIHYSLLNRAPERDGTIAACRELGVTVIAYSPIEKGMLSGKYTVRNVPPGLRQSRYNREYLARVQPLIELMREIGQAHGGKSPAQVALNWLMRKGTAPIPGAKNARQAKENAGALGWQLNGDEMKALDAASERFRRSAI